MFSLPVEKKQTLRMIFFSSPILKEQHVAKEMHTNTAILLPMKKTNFKNFSAVRFFISIKYCLQ